MRGLRALRWWIVGLIMLGAILNFLTRGVMSVAAPTMRQDLAISEREYSWITGAFQLGIMLQPAVGYVLDSVGLRYGLAHPRLQLAGSFRDHRRPGPGLGRAVAPFLRGRLG